LFDIEDYIFHLTHMLQSCFGERLAYVGLQGSYSRNEATQDSDIDVMVVLSDMTVLDLKKYRQILHSLGNEEKACGFICSTSDLANWNPLEICHLLNTTKDRFGNLSRLVPAYSETDVRNFVKLSVNNLYHALCHGYIHAGREETIAQLPGLYKAAFFILQNLYYLESGAFLSTKAQLLSVLTGRNKAVLETAMQIGADGEFDFEGCFERLFLWCQETIRKL